MNKKTIAYMRVSTDMQTIENQRIAIQQYANSHNIVIDSWFQDEGISAYSVDANKREGLNRVREMAHNGEVDTLLVFESSRISRRHLVGQIILSELSSNGVTVISITEGTLNSNEIDSLLNSIRMYSNESSSRLTSQRVKNAKTVMARNGKYLGGRVLMGYKVVDEKLVIDEDLREIIVNMFKIYNNESAKAAIDYLAENGIKKTNQTLGFLLKNKTYIGKYYKTDDNKDIYTESLRIIDDNLFNEVQVKLNERYLKKNARVLTDRTPYLCEGLLYHSCGRKMILSSSNESTVYRSRCKCINQKSYAQHKIDEIVSHKVAKWFKCLDTEELKRKWSESQSKELKQLLINEKRLKDLLANKEAMLDKSNKKLQEAIMSDYPLDMIQIITESINDLKQSINNLKQEIIALEEQIDDTKTIEAKHNSLSEQLLDFKYLYRQADSKHKKLLVRAVVDKVIITSWFDIDVKFKY